MKKHNIDKVAKAQTIMAEAYRDKPCQASNWHHNYSDIWSEARAELKTLIYSQFNEIKTGWRVEAVSGQPYANQFEIIEDLQEAGMLKVSMDNNESCILTPTENFMFRAVHDFHHATLDAGFDMLGEFKTYEYFSSFTDNTLVKQILRSEILVQAAFRLEYGYFGEQKLILE